jgi:hypothetical protein
VRLLERFAADVLHQKAKSEEWRTPNASDISISVRRRTSRRCSANRTFSGSVRLCPLRSIRPAPRRPLTVPRTRSKSRDVTHSTAMNAAAGLRGGPPDVATGVSRLAGVGRAGVCAAEGVPVAAFEHSGSPQVVRCAMRLSSSNDASKRTAAVARSKGSEDGGDGPQSALEMPAHVPSACGRRKDKMLCAASSAAACILSGSRKTVNDLVMCKIKQMCTS